MYDKSRIYINKIDIVYKKEFELTPSLYDLRG